MPFCSPNRNQRRNETANSRVLWSRGETDSEKISALNTFDPAHVQVYREGDLERARENLEQAVQITFLTVVYLDGLFKGRIKPLPWTRGTPTRDQLFHQLYGLRLFQEAWDRIQMDRKK